MNKEKISNIEQDLVNALEGMLHIVYFSANESVREEAVSKAISVYQRASGKPWRFKEIIGPTEPRKMNGSELVKEIDWLVQYYPGPDHEQLRDVDHEYGFRLRNIFNAVDGNAALIVSRCLNGVMSADGFTVDKLKKYWTDSEGMPDEQRLANFRIVKWYNTIMAVHQNDCGVKECL